jgi:hypothetical protein
MVSQPNKASGSGSGSGISFVAFDAGISKETRKAVRVQAAKASAAARKATIARKLAEKKAGEQELERANKAAAEAAVASNNAQQLNQGGHGHGGNLSFLPDFRSFALASYAAQQPPSPAASNSGGYIENDSETDVPRTFQSFSPGALHRALVPSTHSSRSKKHPQDCRCQQCSYITPASSVAASPKSEYDFEMGHSDHIKTEGAIALYSLPRPATISPGRDDPFNCYPVEWHPWFDGLLRYMMTVFAPRAWPVLDITEAQGQRWEWFMTQHAMEEPALFYVRLLFASGDLIRLGALNREASFWLQSQAIKAINEALEDPRRSASDGLILAVGRIALHECMYGDRAASNAVHRPAQRRMIDIRGGMPKLGFPDLVKRLMRWADRVMSMQGNTGRFLPDDEDEGNATYGLRQTVEGYEAWAPPGSGQALRKRISIADLLTD